MYSSKGTRSKYYMISNKISSKIKQIFN